VAAEPIGGQQHRLRQSGQQHLYKPPVQLRRHPRGRIEKDNRIGSVIQSVDPQLIGRGEYDEWRQHIAGRCGCEEDCAAQFGVCLAATQQAGS
jgi:hypothetical protein